MGAPLPIRKVNVVVVTFVTGSLNVAVTGVPSATLVALGARGRAVTLGRVVSAVTVTAFEKPLNGPVPIPLTAATWNLTLPGDSPVIVRLVPVTPVWLLITALVVALTTSTV